MATHRAISATGKSIVGLLAEQCLNSEFAGAEFQLCQPADLLRPKRASFGISICLCRAGFDSPFRNAVPPAMPNVPGQRPPLALELSFLMTAWARTPERQHDLLAWAMCLLHENPILSASLLNRFAGGTGDVFAPTESVEVIPANLDFEQMRTVCELVHLRQQPAIVYLVRPVAIQSRGNSTGARRHAIARKTG